jgi:hypothetical protein
LPEACQRRLHDVLAWPTSPVLGSTLTWHGEGGQSRNRGDGRRRSATYGACARMRSEGGAVRRARTRSRWIANRIKAGRGTGPGTRPSVRVSRRTGTTVPADACTSPSHIERQSGVDEAWPLLRHEPLRRPCASRPRARSKIATGNRWTPAHAGCPTFRNRGCRDECDGGAGRRPVSPQARWPCHAARTANVMRSRWVRQDPC